MTYYRTEVLADSPAIYMPLDGDLTTNLGSKTGVTVNSSGGFAYGTGRIGQAPDFTGPSTAARINYNLNGNAHFNDSTWTIEMWFRVDALTGGYMDLFQINDSAGNIVTAFFEFSNARKLTVRHRAQNGTLYTQATSHIQNNSWHHFAMVRNGTTLTAYVDGSQVVTTTIAATNPNFASNVPFFIGAYGDSAGNENFDGAIDEFAIYDTALSQARINAHYMADTTAPNPNGGYTAQVMTATATMVDPVVKATGQFATLTYDAQWKVNDTSLGEADTELDASTSMVEVYGGGPTVLGTRYLKTQFTKSSIAPAGSTISSATLRVYLADRTTSAGAQMSTGQTQTFQLHTRTGGTNASPTYTSVSSITTTDDPLWLEFDVTSALPYVLGSGVTTVPEFRLYLAPTSTGRGKVRQSEYGSPFIPELEVKYSITPVSVSPSATPMTATAFMPNAVASVVKSNTFTASPMTALADTPGATAAIGTSFTASPLTASVAMPDPLVMGQREATVLAESMTAEASMPGGGFAQNATGVANPMTASAAMPDAAAGTTRGVTVPAVPMAASAQWVRPTGVNGAPIILNDAEDLYFQRVNAIGPDFWIRQTGTGEVINNRVTNQPMADYRGGVLRGRFNGPDGRASVYLDGTGFIEQREVSGVGVDEATPYGSDGVHTTFEFTIKTAKASQFLAISIDQTISPLGIATPTGGNELFMANGRIGYRTYKYNSGNPSLIDGEFVGTTALNDDQWHHIVVRSGVRSPRTGESGVEILIDGKLEIRRYNVKNFTGFPDYVGARPSGSVDAINLAPLPASQNYVGELSEIVFYYTTNPSVDTMIRNYYAFMGWKPIEVPAMEANAELVNAKGRGNRKRALYLYWSRRGEAFGGTPGGGDNNHQSPENTITFDPMPSLAESAYAPSLQPMDNSVKTGSFYGMDVRAYNILVSPKETNYRDPVTDEPTFIDLERDVNLDDYDVIMFKDWPDEGYEIELIAHDYQPGSMDRLLGQLRDANDRGIGLYVTNPRLAVDLGIIDRVEYVPSVTEVKSNSAQGNAETLYDYGSALKFPWNISISDGRIGRQFAFGIGEAEDLTASFLDNKAYYYYDTNKNNRYRVRALIEGLTDLPGWMVKESVFHVDADFYGEQGLARKYLKREDGLLIGDEYIFYGSAEIAPAFLDLVERRYQRFSGTWATPPGHVKAGTIVTTFGAKLWQGKSEVDNPYRDYATTVVLDVGDTLAGRPVGGRIFVNFTEQPNEGLAVPYNVLPNGPTTGFVPGYPNETAAQREWDLSWTRTTLTSTTVTQSQTVTVTLPNGQTQAINISGNGDNQWSISLARPIFPTAYAARVEMDTRGIFWLLSAPEPDPDGVQAKALPMTATAEMPSANAVAQRDIHIGAEPMTATAVMPKVAEDKTGDAGYLALPMTASATFTNYGKTIAAEPMLATATLVENFNMVHASGEQIALTLHNYEVELYLKEDA